MNTNEQILYFFEEKKYHTDYLVSKIGEQFLEQIKKESICVLTDSGLKFQYVGLLAYRDKVVVLLPKYISEKISETEKQLRAIKLVKVLQKYERMNPKKTDSDILIRNNEREFANRFAVADFLLRDFMINGYYQSFREEIFENGKGEISWDETINLTSPFFVKRTPYYLNTMNKEIESDLSNFILAVHKSIIYECYKKYGSILGYSFLNVSKPRRTILELGPIQFILKNLKKELYITFIDQRIRLIKSMIAFLNEEYNSLHSNLSLYGTKSFEYIWEYICGYIFNNQYKEYISLIPPVRWLEFSTNQIKTKGKPRPDILKIYEDESGKKYFIIIDAKYFNIKFWKGELIGNPDVYDVEKQILYEKLFKPHFPEYEFGNVFLFPNELGQNNYNFFGAVNMDFIGEKPVILVYLDTKLAYSMFLKEQRFNDEEIMMFVKELMERRIYAERLMK